MPTIVPLLLLAFATRPQPATQQQQKDEDTCLLLAARNLSSGGGNFHLFYVLSEKPVEIRAGDKLRYDVFLAPTVPVAKGGIDVLFSDNTSLRDSGAKDTEGFSAHGDA